VLGSGPGSGYRDGGYGPTCARQKPPVPVFILRRCAHRLNATAIVFAYRKNRGPRSVRGWGAEERAGVTCGPSLNAGRTREINGRLGASFPELSKWVTNAGWPSIW
jgi:hypothetical protein